MEHPTDRCAGALRTILRDRAHTHLRTHRVPENAPNAAAACLATALHAADGRLPTLQARTSGTFRLMDIGDQIGHYRLEALLGEGSQAEVWRATMQGPGSFQRAVALRWMLDANPSTVIREHRLGGLLRHPHLVEVYEIDANESATWVAQELMAGGTLYEAIRDEPLSPRAVAELGHALAQALAHLHEKGLVHRDVTPANVLLLSLIHI